MARARSKTLGPRQARARTISAEIASSTAETSDGVCLKRELFERVYNYNHDGQQEEASPGGIQTILENFGGVEKLPVDCLYTGLLTNLSS